jgi:hypothetical protein
MHQLLETAQLLGHHATAERGQSIVAPALSGEVGCVTVM